MSQPQFREHIEQLRGTLGQVVEPEEDEDENAEAGNEEDKAEEEAPKDTEVKQVITDEEDATG